MSAVKSEIAIEINGVSEKLLSEVKDTAQRLDKCMNFKSITLLDADIFCI